MPLQRLDNDARMVFQLANDIAHEYEQEYVGTEHVLLAILRHDTCAGARALNDLGVDEQAARSSIDELIQRAKEDTWVFGRLPGSPHYRGVIERALEIAGELDHTLIGSSHLLLALFHDKESTARQTLATLGVTYNQCREAVIKQLAADGF